MKKCLNSPASVSLLTSPSSDPLVTLGQNQTDACNDFSDMSLVELSHSFVLVARLVSVTALLKMFAIIDAH